MLIDSKAKCDRRPQHGHSYVVVNKSIAINAFKNTDYWEKNKLMECWLHDSVCEGAMHCECQEDEMFMIVHLAVTINNKI